MVRTLHSLFARFRPQLYELAGAGALVYGLAQIRAWAAWLGAAGCLLAKSLEADLKRGDS